MSIKFKFLLTALVVFALALFSSKSYAQEFYKYIASFDTSAPVSTKHFTKEQLINSSNTFQPSPITYVTIKQGSFTQDVNVLIYKGNWDVLTVGKKDYTPISAFYIAFLDSGGKEISSSKIVEVFSYNNYVGTDATFTPVSKSQGIPNPSNTVVFKNQANVRAILPQSDGGFIISINKTIDKNDASLNPKIATPPPAGGPTQTTTQPPKSKSFISQNILLISVLAVMIIAIVVIVITLFWKEPKKPIG